MSKLSIVFQYGSTDTIELKETVSVVQQEVSTLKVSAASKDYVDHVVGAIDIPEVDLTPYATKASLEQLSNTVDEKIASIDIPETDLSNYDTKPEVDDKIKTAIDDIDFTAFRVYADDTDDHTQFYEVGEDCPQFVPASAAGSKSIISYRIPKSQTIVFGLWLTSAPEENDVIIDWGDGTKSIAKNGLTQSFTGNGYVYSDDSGAVFAHRYAAEGSYYVKITGKQYSAIRPSWATLNIEGVEVKSVGFEGQGVPWQLVYEIFGEDTPIASCVSNLASFMAYNNRIMYIPAATKFFDRIVKHVVNWSQCFLVCHNLISVSNFYFSGFALTNTQTVANMFEGCSALETYHGQLPAICTSGTAYSSTFSGCKNLSIVARTILPTQGIIANKQGVASMFSNCVKLRPGSASDQALLAERLWNNTKVMWSGTESCFKTCSDEMRAAVPVSWGGTNTEIVVPQPVTKQYVDEAMSSIDVADQLSNYVTNDSLASVLDTKIAEAINEDNTVELATYVKKDQHDAVIEELGVEDKSIRRLVEDYVDELRFYIKSFHTPESEIEVTTTTENAVYQINVTSPDASAVISWGDKTENTQLTTTSQETVSHTYATPGTYKVKISGTHTNFNHLKTGMTPLDGANQVTKANKLATCVTSCVGMFLGTSVTIDKGFQINPYVTDCSIMFCGSTLEEIPTTFIVPDNVQSTESMFAECVNLKAIPENFKLAAPICSTMFYGCTSLTQIPSTLIIRKTVKRFDYMFYNCTGITEIPANFTDLIPESVISMTATFAGTGITSVPSTFKIPSTVLTVEKLFYQAKQLESVDAIVLPDGLLSCKDMFGYCTKLTSIAEGFSLGNTITTCRAMFGGSSALTTIPSTLTIPESCTETYSMFNNCSNLTTIPDTFTLPEGLKDMGTMFRNCKALTSVPSNFVVPASIVSAKMIFQGCSALECDISNVLSKTYAAGTDFNYLFNDCSKVYGDIDGTLLWEREATEELEWKHVNVFTGCTALLAQEANADIPTTWGGNAVVEEATPVE